jgi:carbohydrate kinase (thermoresistant glucokinase family)
MGEHPLVVVMGVSGSGKSTIGALVADALGVPFVDGDALHPVSNIAKMATGTPLTDEDRWPWLATIGETLAEAGGAGLVVASSALKRRYRDAILQGAPTAVFLHLDGAREVLSSRLEGRSGHFMPASLLASQLETLERLEADEPGFVVDIGAPVDDVVAAAVETLGRKKRQQTPPHAGSSAVVSSGAAQ